VSIYVSISS